MQQRGLDILNTAKRLDGQTVREWLDELLKNKKISFRFGTEWYRMTDGLYFIAWYKNEETGKGCDLWPRERDYIAEALYPDTQKVIDAHNEAHRAKASAKWREFLELRPDAKIEEGLKKSLERMGEAGLYCALYDEQHPTK